MIYILQNIFMSYTFREEFSLKVLFFIPLRQKR